MIDVAQKGVLKMEHYEAPVVEIMEVVVEQGFQASPSSGISPREPDRENERGSY